jgi:nicotinamide mononucleotide adenylyltransferase
MIDYSKPTAQMLGRWQPFHDGHLALFKEILKKTGQVVIMVRDLCHKQIIHLYLMI